MVITTRTISEGQMLKLFEEAESCMQSGLSMNVEPEIMLAFLVNYAIHRKTEMSDSRR